MRRKKLVSNLNLISRSELRSFIGDLALKLLPWIWSENAARIIPANTACYALVTFLFLAVAAAVSLLVVGLRRGFWAEKKRLLAVLAVLVAGLAVGITYWALVLTGYNDLPSAEFGPHVGLYTVEVLGRVSSLMFLLLLSLFTWLLLAAVVETVFPERKRLGLVVAATMAIIAVCAISYSITMSAIHSQFQEALVVDASGPMFPGVSFLFSAALTAMRAAAW